MTQSVTQGVDSFLVSVVPAEGREDRNTGCTTLTPRDFKYYIFKFKLNGDMVISSTTITVNNKTSSDRSLDKN